MRPHLRIALAVGIAVAVTFVATAMYYNQRVSKQILSLFVAEAVEMEAFNDVGRVERYDTLEGFLRRGCVKEALEFVQGQQRLLLSGIAYRMKENEGARKTVLSRNATVAERARLEGSKSQPTVVYEPRCQ